MVLDEALRLYPPAYTMNRVALAADRIGPVEIARGDLVSLSPYVTHRNPKLWDEPERFDPERFAPERAAGRPKFAYFPFGGGPRVCIGNGFALMGSPDPAGEPGPALSTGSAGRPRGGAARPHHPSPALWPVYDHRSALTSLCRDRDSTKFGRFMP